MSTSFEFIAEYAKTGRAKCKGCGVVIEKDALRIGVKSIIPPQEQDLMEDSRMTHIIESTRFYHLECLNMFRQKTTWWQQHAPPMSDVVNYENLQAHDAANVSDLFVSLQSVKEEDSVPATKKKAKSVKEEENLEPATKKKAKSVKEEIEDEDYDEKKPNKTQTKKRGERNSVGEVPNAKKAKRSIIYRADSIEDSLVEKIQEQIEMLSSKTQAQLKAMLQMNGLKMSGNKAELLERVAESSVLGALPKCPECDAHLRWNKNTGLSTCPGKYSETLGQIELCSFSTASIERLQWRF